MTDRDRLIELLKPYVSGSACEQESGACELTNCRSCNALNLADRLLANGVIVPPCKVGDYVRFKGLTSLWRVEAIHYYREGLPQISVTNGKVTTTVTDDRMFEVFTKEEAEEKLKERGCDE